METSRGDGAAATWIYQRRRVAATPRLPRGYSAETGARLRYQPLSVVTVGALEDSGFTALAYDQADPITESGRRALREQRDRLPVLRAEGNFSLDGRIKYTTPVRVHYTVAPDGNLRLHD